MRDRVGGVGEAAAARAVSAREGALGARTAEVAVQHITAPAVALRVTRSATEACAEATPCPELPAVSPGRVPLSDAMN